MSTVMWEILSLAPKQRLSKWSSRVDTISHDIFSLQFNIVMCFVKMMTYAFTDIAR